MCEKNCGFTSSLSVDLKYSLPGFDDIIVLFFKVGFGNTGRTSRGGFPVYVSLLLHEFKTSHPNADSPADMIDTDCVFV